MSDENALTEFDEPEDRIAVQNTTLSAMAKSEVEAQLDAAHRYPRSVTKFLREALSLASINVEVAQSCIYALPRGGKTISGPSVRLAEICASAWGNLHVAARIVGIEDTNIVAQGGAWDLEKNLRYSVETRRKITDKNGKRYNEDMVVMTGNAAASIALRNAIFRAIPRAYVDQLYAQVRKVAVGDATTLVARRDAVLGKLAKMGADLPRVLGALGKKGVDDIGLDELEVLIGYGTSIKDGSRTVDELFPVPGAPTGPTQQPLAAEDQGRRMPLGGGKQKKLDIQVDPAAAETGGAAANVASGREPGQEG